MMLATIYFNEIQLNFNDFVKNKAKYDKHYPNFTPAQPSSIEGLLNCFVNSCDYK